MKKLLIVFLCLLATPACADEWTQKDTAYQTTLMILKGVDWLQTKEITRNPRYSEANPILGGNPSQNKVDVYFACSAIGHTTIAYLLPKKYRRIWQCVFIGIQLGCVYHNYNAGIRIKF